MAELKIRASRAMFLLSLQGAFARVVMFLSNWVLGGLLSQEAFGVSGMTWTVASIAFALISVGLDEVIMQRGAARLYWDRTANRLSLIFAGLTTLAVVLFAPLAALLYGEPAVVGPILVAAAALPFAGACVVPSARLYARLDFGFMVQWGTVDLFLIQGLTILFAFLGLGAYSFVLPLPIAYAARAIAFRLRAGAPDRPVRKRRMPVLPLLRRGAMVTGSRFMNSLVSQGDYIVLGVLASTTAVGVYYFALRLAAAPVRTIAQTLAQVLFPAMTSLQQGADKLAASAMRTARLLTWIVSPFCFYQMALADPLLRFLFADKWAASIPIMQLLSIGLSMEAVMAVARAYLSAAGRFELSLRYSLANGAGYFAACCLGAYLGGAIGVATAVSVYYLATQPLAFLAFADRSRRRARNFIEIFLLPTAASAAAFGLAWRISLMGPFEGPIWRMAVVTAVGWPLAAALFYLLAPTGFREVVRLLSGALKRRRAKAPDAPAA